ncbi:MAG: hypothetical protein PHH08_03420 [Candidatus ainarchaeum sp.]|nr:hypothetical protein [Candidatus ainarchaeum sp.]
MSFPFLARQARHELKCAGDFLEWSSRRGIQAESRRPSKETKALLKEKKAELKEAKKDLAFIAGQRPGTPEEFQKAVSSLNSVKRRIVSIKADLLALANGP